MIKMRNKEEKARTDRKCRHFRSVASGSSCCASVAYLSLGNGNQWPCFGDVGDTITTCERHQPFTPEEIQEKQEKRNETVKYVGQAMAIVRGTEGSGGAMDCPKCSNPLHWSRASNGHTHGQCSSGNCIAWMT